MRGRLWSTVKTGLGHVPEIVSTTPRLYSTSTNLPSLLPPKSSTLPALLSTTSPKFPSRFVPPKQDLTSKSWLKLPRKVAYTAGPDVGTFASKDPSEFRALVNTAEIVKKIDKEGYKSGQKRLVESGKEIDLTVPQDKPGQKADELSDEQLVAYSGLKSGPKYNPNNNIVGTNVDPLHTLGVGVGTSGGKGGLEAEFAKGKAGRIDEILPELVASLKGHSVEDAFKRLAPDQNRWPVEGEKGYKGEIPPTAFGHSVKLPLGGFGPELYLKNLGLLTESSSSNPKKFRITTKEHVHPETGEKIPIDTFHEDEDYGKK